ncbi:MAG TPA: hypothetical protein VKQ11_17515 [Candidatus Sulfotelmatobacter sp.]|nr:hypothetical protein [Candidatus Sulfotelmatobacter sp.]
MPSAAQELQAGDNAVRVDIPLRTAPLLAAFARSGIPELLRVRFLQLSALTLFLTVVGSLAFQYKLCVLDPDIWWHLKVGDWIVEHHAVPHTGILSRTAANRPWVAYSWGYELLISRAYAWFGLLGIGLYGTLLTLMVAYAVYWMLRRISGRFWVALIGAAIACSAFLFNGMPRPFFFSIALFAVTLTLLLEANRTGRIERLYWLPLIFCLWANLHIQFIYGLFLVGLFVAVHLVLRLGKVLRVTPDFLAAPSLPTAPLIAVAAACMLATFAGPYTYHPYQVVYEYSKAKFTYAVILELQPLTFRGFSNFLQLFLTAAAFFAVGWKRKLDLFMLALLTAASVIAYRTMRDAWFICLPAATCIAGTLALKAEDERTTTQLATPVAENWFIETWLEKLGVAAAVIVLLALTSNTTDFTPRGLDRVISGQYPVNAVNFLRRNPLPGPLYNHLNWGGFLMWYMPQYPVAIDGRNDLYGDELDQTFFNSQSAEKSYETDPYLNEAGVVLLSSDLPLAKVLTVDSRFQLVYRDSIATVFARRSPVIPLGMN